MGVELPIVGGVTIPLISEFLSYPEGDAGSTKQNCETKGFKRLAKQLKRKLPNLTITGIHHQNTQKISVILINQGDRVLLREKNDHQRSVGIMPQ